MMKLIKSHYSPVLLSAFVLILTATSCKKNTGQNAIAAENTVHFTSSIGGKTNTKVTGNAWETNDNIGLFVNKSTDNSTIDTNKKYTTTGNGNFTPVGSTNAVSYPIDGSSVNFVAYYPFTTPLTGNIYRVDVASQINLATIDLLYSNNAVNFNKAGTTLPNLDFKHQLAKLEILVKAGNGVNINGLTAELAGLNTKADFDLNTGTLAPSTAPLTIPANVQAAGADVLVSAILLPAGIEGKTISFKLSNGSAFTWAIPTGTILEKGKKHSYTVELNTSANENNVVVLGNASINNWVDMPDPGNVNLDPHNGPILQEQQIFLETCGPVKVTTTTYIAQHTGWDNSNLQFTGTSNQTQIRTFSPLSTNQVQLPSPNCTFSIAGINTNGFSNMKLSFKVVAPTASATTPVNINILKVYYNNVAYAIPSTVANSSTTIYTVEVDFSSAPASATGTILFNNGTTQFRIDDFKLVGSK